MNNIQYMNSGKGKQSLKYYDNTSTDPKRCQNKDVCLILNKVHSVTSVCKTTGRAFY